MIIFQLTNKFIYISCCLNGNDVRKLVSLVEFICITLICKNVLSVHACSESS